jgi:hypothetical protein
MYKGPFFLEGFAFCMLALFKFFVHYTKPSWLTKAQVLLTGSAGPGNDSAVRLGEAPGWHATRLVINRSTMNHG